MPALPINPCLAVLEFSLKATSACLTCTSCNAQAVSELQMAALLPDIFNISNEMWVALCPPVPDSCCHWSDPSTPALLCLGQILVQLNALLPQRPLVFESGMFGIWRGKCISCMYITGRAPAPMTAIIGLASLSLPLSPLPIMGAHLELHNYLFIDSCYSCILAIGMGMLRHG